MKVFGPNVTLSIIQLTVPNSWDMRGFVFFWWIQTLSKPRRNSENEAALCFKCDILPTRCMQLTSWRYVTFLCFSSQTMPPPSLVESFDDSRTFPGEEHSNFFLYNGFPDFIFGGKQVGCLFLREYEISGLEISKAIEFRDFKLMHVLRKANKYEMKANWLKMQQTWNDHWKCSSLFCKRLKNRLSSNFFTQRKNR